MKIKKNLTINRYQWASAVLAEISTQNPEKKILFDIGARDEILKMHIEVKNINYQGYDLNPLNANIKLWDIEQPLGGEGERVDIVTFLEVIEHLKNPWISVNNIANVIKPGGFLILSTPNPAWSTSRLDLLLRGYLSCFTKKDLILNHHVFTPWLHILEKILLDTGFEVIEVVTLDGKTKIFDRNLSLIKFPFQITYRILKKIIEKLDSSSCGMSLGIVAKKR